MTTEAPSLSSELMNGSSKSAEISEHVIVDETQAQTKNASVSVDDASPTFFQDRLFTITKSELLDTSLVKILCPVDDYVYFDVKVKA